MEWYGRSDTDVEVKEQIFDSANQRLLKTG
jgi:hypothetical protein